MGVPSERRVLVVDDDATWREYLLAELKGLGYAGKEASTGAEALEHLAQEPFSVMLLDLHMPGMGGEEVVKRLPQGSPPVVLMTSSPASEAGQVLRQGAHYYLPKGATPEQLLLILQSLEA